MNRKVYFAGSIRGGRNDAQLYHDISELIKETDMVLTEHVGDLDLASKEEGKRDRLIYEQDTAWLRESDILIAECTCPSLGVGYELAYAERYQVPCHVFYRKSEVQLSAMITGDPYYQIHPYETKEELFEMIGK